MADDKSYNALFNPGAATDLFKHYRAIAFDQHRKGYSHANAWWLAEFCRLIYKIDDHRGQIAQSDSQISQLLMRIGWTLEEVVTDSKTSTCAALFNGTQQNSNKEQPVLVVAFCGSNEALDWKINFQAGQISTSDFGKVHQGFFSSAHSVSEILMNEISKHDGPVFLTGHSLGAALASVIAAELGHQNVPFRACYSFGSPRVGDQQFARVLDSLPFYRIVNNCDLVTSLPVSLGANEYVHPDNAWFFDNDGGVADGITDAEIQQRQAAYFPSLKRYLEGQQLMSRIKTLSNRLPDNFADHAIVNYADRFSSLLGAT